MAENIQLAVRGWQHVHWNGSFYPDDLPADWQLAYYANEFDAVLIPADYWTAERLQTDTDWCEQVQPNFCFYLEWPEALAVSAVPGFIDQLVAMQPNLAALLTRQTLPAAQLSQLQQRLPGLACTPWHSLWTPAADNAAQNEASLAWLDQPWRDLRELRRWLDAFAPKQGRARQALLCTMAQPKIQPLQEARTLLQLMGL